MLADLLYDALRRLMASVVIAALDKILDSVNGRVLTVAEVIGRTPEEFNGSVYSMMQSLAEGVCMPIAGMVLAVVMTCELLSMATERNTLAEGDLWPLFRWVARCFAAVLLVSNAWNIVMGLFDVTKAMVNAAAGVITGTPTMHLDIMLSETQLEEQLLSMHIGTLLLLALEITALRYLYFFVGIVIEVIVVGRIIEVYLMSAVAPIPIAMSMGRSVGSVGRHYLLSMAALGLQAFFMMVSLAIHAALVGGIELAIADATQIQLAMANCLVYTVLLFFILMKTGSLAQRVLGTG